MLLLRLTFTSHLFLLFLSSQLNLSCLLFLSLKSLICQVNVDTDAGEQSEPQMKSNVENRFPYFSLDTLCDATKEPATVL